MNKKDKKIISNIISNSPSLRGYKGGGFEICSFYGRIDIFPITDGTIGYDLYLKEYSSLMDQIYASPAKKAKITKDDSLFAPIKKLDKLAKIKFKQEMKILDEFLKSVNITVDNKIG